MAPRETQTHLHSALLRVPTRAGSLLLVTERLNTDSSPGMSGAVGLFSVPIKEQTPGDGVRWLSFHLLPQVLPTVSQ